MTELLLLLCASNPSCVSLPFFTHSCFVCKLIPKPISVFPSVNTWGLKDSISTLGTSLEVKWGACSPAALPFANALLAGGRRKKSLLIYRSWLSQSLLFTVTLRLQCIDLLGGEWGVGFGSLPHSSALSLNLTSLWTGKCFFFIFQCCHSPPNCQENLPDERQV